jgi:hypothetical protein
VRARLGPDVLDCSIFAGAGNEPAPANGVDTIRQALLLVQVTEAVVKALECYPVEILETGRYAGQRFVTLRAEPDNDRDRFAKQVGMSDSATALKRLFEEDRRDAEGKWRISLSPSLGATRSGDITATFVDIRDCAGRQGYQFEIDDELPPDGPYFLKTERDTGTERVINRRLRNIKALDTRIDLADMLDDPWRMRRSSRETISEADQKEEAFLDLDGPKQRALLAFGQHRLRILSSAHPASARRSLPPRPFAAASTPHGPRHRADHFTRFLRQQAQDPGQACQRRRDQPPPFVHRAPMPASPVTVVNFEHVSASGKSRPIERGRPRWHNPSEVEAVLDVLRLIRRREGAEQPTLAVLSPYLAQVDLLERRIAALRANELAHLDQFASVRSGGGFVGTVDSFQGSEADLVIVSLVRNNPRTGGAALGFPRDRRRMNVALSRAKSQLVLVGSLDFLREAVRGVNPDDEPHDLSFLTRITETIDTLRTETRGPTTFRSPQYLRRPRSRGADERTDCDSRVPHLLPRRHRQGPRLERDGGNRPLVHDAAVKDGRCARS